MPITNVNQEPANLQELLLVKSMPILSKMLGPKINGSNVNNYQIVDVEEINNETFVIIESTKDPLVEIDTATAEQKIQRRIPYIRHSIKSVFDHYLGTGPFTLPNELPSTIDAFNTFLADRDVPFTLDADEIYFSAYEVSAGIGRITLSPKDAKDLKWKGVYHFTATIVEAEVEPEPGPTLDDVTFNLSGTVNATPDDILAVEATIPPESMIANQSWTLSPTNVPAGLTLTSVDKDSAELVLDAVAVGTYALTIVYNANGDSRDVAFSLVVAEYEGEV